MVFGLVIIIWSFLELMSLNSILMILNFYLFLIFLQCTSFKNIKIDCIWFLIYCYFISLSTYLFFINFKGLSTQFLKIKKNLTLHIA